MISRRYQLAAMLGALAVPRIVAAQERRRPRLAFFVPLIPEAAISETGGEPHYRSMLRELRRRGYEEGQTLDVGRWSARGDPARYPELARDIVRSQPDAIYAVDTALVQALAALTMTIPIIAQNVQLVDAGLADSYSRPGRNVTGFSAAFSWRGVTLKVMQLLREAMPAASRIAVLARRTLWDSDAARQFREDGSRIGLTMVGALMDEPIQPPEYHRVFAAMPDQRIDAVWVPFFSIHYVHRHLIIELATANRLPAITFIRDATERGGLMSYGLDLAETGRIAADMVVRVLQGEKPADMPLRSIDKLELVINLKTAMALGLTIPPSILARADELIE
jgi:putative ABC transport system substrate-binding protein